MTISSVFLRSLFAMLTVLAATMLLDASSKVMASSSGIVRDLSSTNIRPCPAPDKLREHYIVFSTPYGESIEIVCLETPTSAAWILTAEAFCGASCPDRLASPVEHAARTPEASASPRVVTYTASDYEIREECTLGNGRNRRGVVDAPWTCRRSISFSPQAPFTVRATGATTDVADIGTGLIRDLTETSLRSCPSGDKLVEFYRVSKLGMGDSYGESLEIACRQSATSAAWVFLAATDFESCRACSGKRLPQMAFPSEHRDTRFPLGSGLSPATVTYEISKSLSGEDCLIEDHKNLVEVQPFWSCRVFAPSSIKQTVTTVGATRTRDPDADEQDKLPFKTSQKDDTFILGGVFDED